MLEQSMNLANLLRGGEFSFMPAQEKIEVVSEKYRRYQEWLKARKHGEK